MNTRWINTTTLGALLGLSFSGAAWAGAGPEQGAHGPHGGAGAAAMADHVFARMDENKDGQVTRQEADQMSQRLFERLDANKDGQVTREEADTGAQAIRTEELAARFKQMDVNGDGKLSTEECKLPAKIFDVLDGNHDHTLTLDEFQAGPDVRAGHREFEFDQADQNHDGKVTRAEATARAKARFDSVDANHDNVLTRQEFSTHVAQKLSQAEGAAKSGPTKDAPTK